MAFNRRKLSLKKSVDRVADDVDNEVNEPLHKKLSIKFDKVISTGSTTLDLAISGSRVRGGGIPGGTLAEIFGPSGSGKTSILVSLGTSTQLRGGMFRCRDPESRLDKEYAQVYNLSIKKAVFDYERPNTVKEMFNDFYTWDVFGKKNLNLFGADSIAALSTEMEMEGEDKRGQKQAKEFSQNLRKCARKMGDKSVVLAFTNQVRQGEYGETTPCGKAMEFYGSLRIRVQQVEQVLKEIKLKSGKVVKRAIGIRSECYVKKSTLDWPYRTASIYIMFNHGIDDIRGNLQFIKDITKATKYDCFGKSYQSMVDAVAYIENKDLEVKLRNTTIDLWEEIESKFDQKRKPKVWF